jgi:hypothetical protein
VTKSCVHAAWEIKSFGGGAGAKVSPLPPSNLKTSIFQPFGIKYTNLTYVINTPTTPTDEKGGGLLGFTLPSLVMAIKASLPMGLYGPYALCIVG